MSITFSSESSPESLELNVSNRNGFVILRELLDQGSEVECYGSLDPSSVLRSLAVARARITGIVRPTTDTQGERVVLSAEGVSVEKACRVIDFGITEEQVYRYVNSLTALARFAEARGESISYG